MDLLLREGSAALEQRVASFLPSGGARLGRSASLPLLVKWFIHQSHHLRYRDPEKMLHFAALARAGADACSASQAGSSARLFGLRTRAWSSLGNALRIRGDSRNAEECFATAYSYYFSSNGDLEVQAELLQKIGSFKTHRCHFSDSIGILQEAGEIYEELGQKSKFASVLIQEAIALIELGDAQEGIRKLGTALPLIDPEEDRYLLIAVRHNLVRCYAELGRVKQAFGLLAEVKKERRSEDSLLGLRATWQEGRLFHEIGELKAADQLLSQARRGFMAKGLLYEVGVIALALGDIYLRQNRLNELRSLLGETAPLFAALKAKREFLAVLVQLGEAAGVEVNSSAQ